jgi:hypothetical protein
VDKPLHRAMFAFPAAPNGHRATVVEWWLKGRDGGIPSPTVARRLWEGEPLGSTVVIEGRDP